MLNLRRRGSTNHDHCMGHSARTGHFFGRSLENITVVIRTRSVVSVVKKIDIQLCAQINLAEVIEPTRMVSRP